MSSSGPAKNKARSVPAKVQGRKVLRALCNFMLPIVQGAGGKTINMKKVRFGIEADEFVTELEIFMSGMISPSRPHSQEIAIEARLDKDKDWVDYFEGTNWLWEIAAAVDKTTISVVSGGEGNRGQLPADESMIKYRAVPQPMSLTLNSKVWQLLENLRRHISQKMPIRLLCFEPHNGKLKISLLNRAEVYNYLSRKLHADSSTGGNLDYSWISAKATYAILSHTWTQTPGELTYDDLQNGALDETHPKCEKLINFCKAAWEDYGLTLGWIDTVCINKASSSELDESIRSMYTWYSDAKVCITYLAGTTVLSHMHNDPWFTRGWTFQELVAPRHIKFYNKGWNQLSSGNSSESDKQNPFIRKEIRLATTMDENELRIIGGASISRRMQLAAKRQVTREEDIAYCLMGIFDVSISMAYGEGAKRAFFRLVEEIFRSTKNVSDIFNWAGINHGSGTSVTSLFPSHPSNYLNRSSNKQLRPWRPMEPLTLTHLGLRTPILLMPAVPVHYSARNHQLIGDFYSTISVDPCLENNLFGVPRDYHLLDKRFSGPEGTYKATIQHFSITSTFTIGTLNVEDQGTSIHIPKTCLAVLLSSIVEYKVAGEVQKEKHSPHPHRIHTNKPIVFNLQKTGNNTNGDKHYYELERSELVKHGMELVTLYL